MGVVLEKVNYPVVDTVQYCELWQLIHQRRVSDRIKRLRKIKGEDMDVQLFGAVLILSSFVPGHDPQYFAKEGRPQ